LVQAVKAISHTRNNYLSAMYHRLAGRIGKNKATIAVAHAILVIIYHMLKDGTTYQDLGANYHEKINMKATVKRSVKRLEALGFIVSLEARNPAV
jgi:DNA-binding MarR family transcriptional regulator